MMVLPTRISISSSLMSLFNHLMLNMNIMSLKNSKRSLGTMLMACLTLLASCQLEDDLKGNLKDETVGYLEANVEAHNNETMLRSTTTYDVNTFPVTITNKVTQEIIPYENYGILKQEGKIALYPGNYEFKIWYGDGQADAQRKPYFIGKSDFTINLCTTTQVHTVCRLGAVKVQLNVAPSFLEKFNNDYQVTVTNTRGTLYFSQQEPDPIYFKWQEGDKTVSMTVKATNKSSGQTVQKAYELKKPADKDGGLLAPGDVWSVTLDAENGGGGGEVESPSKASFKLSVDLTMNETGETIEVPVYHTDNGGGGGGNEPSVEGPKLTPNVAGKNTWEVDLGELSEPTVKVNMNAPKKLENVVVEISSDNEIFPELIAAMGLTKFDLCHVEDQSDTKDNLDQLGIPYNAQVHGKTNFDFDITSFMGLLTSQGISGTHNFKITITDAAGQSQQGTLVVMVP